MDLASRYKGFFENLLKLGINISMNITEAVYENTTKALTRKALEDLRKAAKWGAEHERRAVEKARNETEESDQKIIDALRKEIKALRHKEKEAAEEEQEEMEEKRVTTEGCACKKVWKMQGA